MRHPVYRNLSGRDTLFGLDLYDLVIMAAVVNLIFRFHQPSSWAGKGVNLVLIGLVYLSLVYAKRQFSQGYLKNLTQFLFKVRRYLPQRDRNLVSFKQVIHEKKRIRQSDA